MSDQWGGLTAEQAMANAAENFRRTYPSVHQLRAAGADAHVARLRAELDRTFSSTRRGRLALRLSRWYARRSRS